MEKFAHQKFLEKNNIDQSALPGLLQQRIRGFEDLQENYEHTVGEHQEELYHRMQMIAHELDEDLEEHFEHQLENNDFDQDDDEQDNAGEEKQEDQGTGEGTEDKEEKEEFLENQPKQQEDTAEPVEEEKEPELPAEEKQMESPEAGSAAPETTSDEEILQSIFHQKKEVHPHHLTAKGFKQPLDKRKIAVGKFCLQKGKYDTCYTITLSGD